MPFEFKTPSRDRGGLIIVISGASSTGKTWTAMEIATGLVPKGEPFAVIDTESGRASHYMDDFYFKHAEIGPPFRPEVYLEAIRAAEQAKFKACVVDSFSHEWAGEGGVLDWQEEEIQRLVADAQERDKRYNNTPRDEAFLRDTLKAKAWSLPKTAHKQIIGRILQTRMHLILNLRAEEKMHIEETVDARGKKKTVYIQAKNLPPIERWTPICCHNPELTFEATISFMLEPGRQGVPIPIKIEGQHRHCLPIDQPIDRRTGEMLAAWARGEDIGSKSAASGTQQAQSPPPASPPAAAVASEPSPPPAPPPPVTPPPKFEIITAPGKVSGENEIEAWRDRFLTGIEKLDTSKVEAMLGLNVTLLKKYEGDWPEEVAAVREAFLGKIGRNE